MKNRWVWHANRAIYRFCLAIHCANRGGPIYRARWGGAGAMQTLLWGEGYTNIYMKEDLFDDSDR